MSNPIPDQQVTYMLPLASLVALGKALFLMSDEDLREKGLGEEDLKRVQETFEQIEEGVEKVLGEDWLDGLDEDFPLAGMTSADIAEAASANVVPLTPFSRLAASLK